MKLHICDIVISILLVIVSGLLGWWSTIGVEDVVSKISTNTISILLPLLVLHTTLMIQLLNEMRRYAEDRDGIDFRKVINAIKRNFVAEVVVIFFAVFMLIGNNFLRSFNATDCVLWNWIMKNSQAITNSIIIFAIFYFMWVIIDETMGFLELFVENNKK